MSKLLVDYSAVSKAASDILARGEHPTVERVRIELGGGSNSTITPLLKQWRQEPKNQSGAVELPKELIESLKSVYKQVQGLAEERVEQIEMARQQEAESSRSALLEAHTVATHYKEERDNLEKENILLKDRLEVLISDHDKLRISESVLTTQLSESNEKLVDAKKQLDELKVHLKSIQDQSIHYQNTLAEERQRERELHVSAVLSLQQKVDHLTTETKELSALCGSLSEERLHLQYCVQQKDSEIENNLLSLRKCEANIDSLYRSNKLLEDELESCRQNLNTAIANNSELSNALLIQSTELDSLKSHNAELKSFVVSSDKKIEILTADLLALTREKSVLEGKLIERNRQ